MKSDSNEMFQGKTADWRWIGKLILAIIGVAAVGFVLILILRRDVREAMVCRLQGKATVGDRVAQYGGPVRKRLAPLFAASGVEYPPRLLVLAAFKEERNLEVWADGPDGTMRHVIRYPILGVSGKLGPKLCEGDRQIPEGVYRVEELNPNSSYHLALRLDYPNSFDLEQSLKEGRREPGSDIMIHGRSSSVGCLAMGDEASEDLFVLTADCGRGNVKVVISPSDLRGRSLPDWLDGLPAWTNQLYAEISQELARLVPAPTQYVRVAAVQCYSRMGDLKENSSMLGQQIRVAAGRGARIVVLPECAAQGYMDPANEVVWTTNVAPASGELCVAAVAEEVSGPLVEGFRKLAKELELYLCVAFIEKEKGRYFNSQVLINPRGRIVAHHRKKNLWAPGDGLWVSEGDRPLQIVETEFGRLGMMICYDTHVLAAQLGKAGADIVLYSVGWYGPNTENWYRQVFPRDYVRPNGFGIVVANWSAPMGSGGWPGAGYSCVIDREGRVLAMAESEFGDGVVVADMKIEGSR